MAYLTPSGRHPGETSVAPEVMTDERAALQGFLQRQRELVVWKVSGLSAAELTEHATPSGMTALGIVAHLTMVERMWFRDRVAGEAGLALPESDEDWDALFRLPAGASTESVVADYAAECEAADAAVSHLSLDAGDPEGATVRWVYLHMIEETARHLGHVDLLRELADGATGEDPWA